MSPRADATRPGDVIKDFRRDGIPHSDESEKENEDLADLKKEELANPELFLSPISGSATPSSHKATSGLCAANVDMSASSGEFATADEEVLPSPGQADRDNGVSMAMAASGYATCEHSLSPDTSVSDLDTNMKELSFEDKKPSPGHKHSVGKLRR